MTQSQWGWSLPFLFIHSFNLQMFVASLSWGAGAAGLPGHQVLSLRWPPSCSGLEGTFP